MRNSEREKKKTSSLSSCSSARTWPGVVAASAMNEGGGLGWFQEGPSGQSRCDRRRLSLDKHSLPAVGERGMVPTGSFP